VLLTRSPAKDTSIKGIYCCYPSFRFFCESKQPPSSADFQPVALLQHAVEPTARAFNLLIAVDDQVFSPQAWATCFHANRRQGPALADYRHFSRFQETD